MVTPKANRPAAGNVILDHLIAWPAGCVLHAGPWKHVLHVTGI